MTTLLRTTSDHPAFQSLIRALDKELQSRYNEEQAVYDQYNKIENNRNIVVALNNGSAVGCGCFKKFDASAVEIKRMYVLPQYRWQHIAEGILNELESWAKEMGFTAAVLETGIKQPEAIFLCQRCGYSVIDNDGLYTGTENSVCIKKDF